MIMINLFSIFDPSTSIILSLNWLRRLYVLSFLPVIYWFVPSRINILFFFVIEFLTKEFKVLLRKNLNLYGLLIYICLFFFIILNNFLGMFSYIFTSSSHLLISFTLSLTLWLSFMIYGWLINTEIIFIHLVPQGTPFVLIPFIVIIESIRNIIRPGTLGVRLAANLIAGHLLITLISSTGRFLSFILLMLMLLCQILLIVLEIRVAIIQAYVFSVLRTLYSTESN